MDCMPQENVPVFRFMVPTGLAAIPFSIYSSLDEEADWPMKEEISQYEHPSLSEDP